MVVACSEKLFHLLYFVLLGLGFYWVSTGEILYTFLEKKTGFSESSEPMTELPTILVIIDSYPGSDFKYQEHFNLSFMEHTSSLSYLANLTWGENSVNGSPLKVDFEEIFDGNHRGLKITPLMTYSSEMPLHYTLTCTFWNTTDTPVVMIRMSSEGNFISLNQIDIDPWFRASPGTTQAVTIFPEKHVLLKSLGKCQDKSYSELWLHNLAKAVSPKCPTPCRKSLEFLDYGKRWNQILEDLPFCQTPEEIECFHEMFEQAKPQVNSKPCTRIQYKGVTKMWNSRHPFRNKARFILKFLDDFTMSVKEEYLIYDYVGFISSVGGTLGICVGISIYGFIEVAVTYFKKLLDWINKQNYGFTNNN